MKYNHNKNLVSNAKELRKNMTKEERHLWYDYLRNKDIRFVRQKIIGNYIVDFYCAKASLVIELDGSQHYEDRGIEYDTQRTKYLEQCGLTVVRIPNNEINSNFNGVCDYLDDLILKSLSQLADSSLYKGASFFASLVKGGGPRLRGGGITKKQKAYLIQENALHAMI
ncbi:MAG: endonuclease domain-containing protein [Eubacterium sp.]